MDPTRALSALVIQYQRTLGAEIRYGVGEDLGIGVENERRYAFDLGARSVCIKVTAALMRFGSPQAAKEFLDERSAQNDTQPR